MTSKTYNYKDLVFPIGDDETANFTVEFISDGNRGHTTIDVPGSNDPEIPGEGTVIIGKGKNLRGERTVSFSIVENRAAMEEEIRVRYLINGKQILEHINPKSESERSRIALSINFPSL